MNTLKIESEFSSKCLENETRRDFQEKFDTQCEFAEIYRRSDNFLDELDISITCPQAGRNPTILGLLIKTKALEVPRRNLLAFSNGFNIPEKMQKGKKQMEIIPGCAAEIEPSVKSLSLEMRRSKLLLRRENAQLAHK